MKEIILMILPIFISCSLKAQFYPQSPNNQVLESIAEMLINLQAYQSDCDLILSLPYGGTIESISTITTKKVPNDTLCGFYYHFLTHENSRKNNTDFTSYYNKNHYSSINGSVRKTSFSDKPDYFRRKYTTNGYFPAIQRSSSYYYVTPYQIGDLINKAFKDFNTKVSQKPDTIINQETCSRFLLTTSENNVTTKIELCFNKIKLYPVYYRKETTHVMGNQYTVATFSNSKVNFNLPEDFFSEKNLIGKDWEVNNTEYATTQSLKVGESAPDWDLPVLGKEEILSSKNLRGKYILLEFTATWCGHCVEAAKAMNAFENRFAKNENLAIVSIFSSEIDKKEQVRNFTERHHAKSAILYSAKNVGDKYQVNVYPNFFIISPDGKILQNYLGYSEEIEEKIADDLNKLIK